MRHQLLKRSRFLEDYREIVLYLADVNLFAADRFCDAVEAALEVLCSHPEMGPQSRVPECARSAVVAVAPLSQLSDFLPCHENRGRGPSTPARVQGSAAARSSRMNRHGLEAKTIAVADRRTATLDRDQSGARAR